MNIEINNCNNIENGNIEIKENTLNIKYAINGTGKTTISKAITYEVQKQDLSVLTPFKYQKDKKIPPKVNGLNEISTVKVFDEEYVNQYVFLEDEVFEKCKIKLMK